MQKILWLAYQEMVLKCAGAQQALVCSAQRSLTTKLSLKESESMDRLQRYKSRRTFSGLYLPALLTLLSAIAQAQTSQTFLLHGSSGTPRRSFCCQRHCRASLKEHRSCANPWWRHVYPSECVPYFCSRTN